MKEPKKQQGKAAPARFERAAADVMDGGRPWPTGYRGEALEPVTKTTVPAPVMVTEDPNTRKGEPS